MGQWMTVTSLFNLGQSSFEMKTAFEIAVRPKHVEDSLLAPAYHRCIIRTLIYFLLSTSFSHTSIFYIVLSQIPLTFSL